MSPGGASDDRSLRIRSIVATWLPALALVAAAVAILGGYAAYTAYASPGTVTEQRQVSSWEGNGSYATSAVVTEPNPLYAVGTELTDRPAYFRSVSPQLDGTFAFEYAASDGGTVDVRIAQRLVLRSVAVDDGGDAPTEYWWIEESIGTATTAGVGPGRSVTATFSRNVSRLAERASAVDERLGGSPGTTELLVVSRVTVDGEINGRPVERRGTYRLPVTVDGATYAPDGSEGAAMTGSTTRRVSRPRTYGPLRRIGGPVAAGLGVVALAGLAYGRYGGRFALSESERAALEFRSTREEFDDWITTARLPPGVRDRPRVDVESLSGLVDTAIDVDARVLERPDGAAYCVLHDGLRYVYEPPTAAVRPASTAADDDGTGGEPAADGRDSVETDGTEDG
jgi:hypothetical protein